MKPHKHAAVIKAWADGARIQYRCGGGSSTWVDITWNPSFDDHHEYRVKPEPKQLWARPAKHQDGSLLTYSAPTAGAYALADNRWIDYQRDSLQWIGPAVLVWEEK